MKKVVILCGDTPAHRAAEPPCVAVLKFVGAALEELNHEVPDFFILGACCSDPVSAGAEPEFRKRSQAFRVLVFSNDPDSSTSVNTSGFEDGVYPEQPRRLEACIASIRKILFGQKGNTRSKKKPQTSPQQTMLTLTTREMAVAALLAKGLLYKEIAERLSMSVPVVHKLQHRLFSKLGVNNRTEAAMAWRDFEQQRPGAEAWGASIHRKRSRGPTSGAGLGVRFSTLHKRS